MPLFLIYGNVRKNLASFVNINNLIKQIADFIFIKNLVYLWYMLWQRIVEFWCQSAQK